MSATMRTKAPFTASQLREFIYYKDGQLFWHPRPTNSQWNGRCANKRVVPRRTRTGYLDVRIRGERLAMHRVVWVLHAGTWPKEVIDHINGNPVDNRIENLRDVDRRTNSLNRAVHRERGLLGMIMHERRLGYSVWRVKIRVHGRQIELGRFPSEAEARAAQFSATTLLTHLGMGVPENPTPAPFVIAP